MTDLEKLKEMQQKLQTEKFSIFYEMGAWFDNIQLCISIFQNGQFLFVNNQWAKILGYNPDEFLNLDYFDLIHPHDVEDTAYAAASGIEGSRPEGFINRFKNKQGGYVWFEWHMSPVCEDGKYYSYNLVLDPDNNVSQAQLVQQTSEERRRRYEQRTDT